MELYGRFIVTLAFGLLGLGLVLRVLLEQVLNDWDVVADAQRGFRRFVRGGLRHSRTEDALLDIDKDRPKELSTRLSQTSRREQTVIVMREPLSQAPVPPPLPPSIHIAQTAARNPVYDEEWS
ncbi:MAG: hypothetical protein HY924_13280 [Elusimicrobia bacterium]|nr:hypothetical protein [Elusimicrobiota bacterium]